MPTSENKSMKTMKPAPQTWAGMLAKMANKTHGSSGSGSVPDVQLDALLILL